MQPVWRRSFLLDMSRAVRSECDDASLGAKSGENLTEVEQPASSSVGGPEAGDTEDRERRLLLSFRPVDAQFSAALRTMFDLPRRAALPT
jgi:hypothetical protein